MIVIDVWTKDESALLEKYIDKEQINNNKDIDITNKTMLNNTILTTKGDLLTYKAKNEYIAKKEDENDILRRAVYNKTSANPYLDHIHQDIKLFHQAINGEHEEDIVSNNSVVIEPNKMTNDMNPFKDKYEEAAPGFKGAYTSVRIPKSRNSPDRNSSDRNYNYRSPPRNKSSADIGSDLENRGIGRDSRIDPSESEYNFRPDSPRDGHSPALNRDRAIRQMMNTANPMSKMPHFSVEVESASVLNANKQLKDETERQSVLIREKMVIDNDIMELEKEIRKLEEQRDIMKNSVVSSEKLNSEFLIDSSRGGNSEESD